MVEIQKLFPDRWKDYRALRLEALADDPLIPKSIYEEEKTLHKEAWQSSIGNVSFALKNNEPIGMSLYIIKANNKTKRLAKIFGMYVRKEYRNQGIGMKLIAGVISSIKENDDIHKIRLAVLPEQEHVVNLYKKCGFNIIGTSKIELNIDGKNHKELVMEKLI